MPATIAHALELRESGWRSDRELLLAHLGERHLLLVLDNFEHLLGAAPLLAELLAACPQLALLVTSRAALRLRSERRFPVPPLAAPPNELLSMEALVAAPAVRLFVERAQAVSPDFILDAGSAHAVAAICRRLDGMPLAIELAAARVGLLRPEALLQRLGHRLPLLTSGPADLPERQQTLRATLAWSHDLLGRPEQVLFRRLAVFVGGWTLEAAESVCAGADLPPQEVLERLGVLVDNSLVHPLDRAASEPRFAMLETVREFAQELLIASGEAEAEAVRARQLGYYLQLAEAAMPQLQGAAQVHWLDRLEAEHDNCRLVLAWPAPPPSMAPQLRLATALRYFWYIRGYHREGRDRLLAALALPVADARTLERARALNAVAFLDTMQGQLTEARPWFEEALAIGRALGDAATQAFALRYLGALANAAGAYTDARRALEESLTHFTALGATAERALALMYLADLAISLGDDRWAEELSEQSIELQRVLQNTNALGYPLRQLGYLALRRGDLCQAATTFLESLTLNQQIGDQQGVAASLVGLAAATRARGAPQRAAWLLGAADAVLASIDTQLLATDRQRQAHALAELDAELGPAALEAERTHGRELSMEQAIALAAAPVTQAPRAADAHLRSSTPA